ncbi:hypothetical protein [Neobacillus jeddahensis]|uniref:hypothetical protein n=1 Tax=Neobacillus jeddahensis TaxID=1461580 RepID=UPI0005AAEB48|nr:hypothetical protein [Neobacillus jeddahensis]
MERSEELFENLKDTILNYAMRIKEIELFGEQIRQNSNHFINERKMFSMETFARNCDTVLNLMKNTDLSVLEIEAIDWFLDGLTISEIARRTSLSRQSCYPLLDQIISRMVETYTQIVGE